MPGLKTIAFVVAASALAALPANAAILTFQAPLTGTAENPDVVTPGTGLVRVDVDDVANTIRVRTYWSGLIGDTIASHIHCCTTPDLNVGVAVGPGTLPGFPLGVKSGWYDVTLDLLAAGTYTAAFLNNAVFGGGGTVPGARNAIIAGLNNGRAYYNIHTVTFPGGEIRGQLSAVPEPGAWGMLIAGFAAAGTVLRRRGKPALA